MIIFAGTHELSLDAKGRVVLPLGLRKCIRENLDDLIAKGFMLRPADGDQFLELYPTEEFEEVVKGLVGDYRRQDTKGQMYIRRFTGSAVAISLDPQFRFVMPDKLKAAVGIQNDVCLVGVPRMIEIWAKDRYERWEKESSELEIPEPAAAPARSGGEGGSSSSG